MIRKLSATPTAMGTKKLKSESRKHSSADRQTERDTERHGRLVLQAQEVRNTRQSSKNTPEPTGGGINHVNVVWIRGKAC